MSLFAGLDIASAEDPNYIKPNKYPAFVYDIKVGPTKNGEKVGMTIYYRIEEGNGAPKNATLQEWQHIPQPADPKNLTEEEKKTLGYLKKRLANLGVPEARMNSVGREDLIGIPCYITVKDGENGYSQVARVEPRTETPEGPAVFTGFNN